MPDGLPARKARMKCNLCFQTFTKNKSLYRHRRSVHEGQGFRCFDCDDGRVYAREDNLNRHKAKFHDDKVEVEECLTCSEMVPQRHFENHLRSEECQKQLVNQTQLQTLQDIFSQKASRLPTAGDCIEMGCRCPPASCMCATLRQLRLLCCQRH